MKQFMLVVLVGFMAHLVAQPHEIDRLKKELRVAKPDTAMVWQYRDLAYYYQSQNSDSVIHYGYAGYDLATSLRFSSGQIWCLYQVALGHELKNELDSTFSVYGRALQIAQSSQDSLSQAKLMNAIGSTHYLSGNFLDALIYFNKGLELSESMNYTEGYAHSLNNIAVIYRIQRRYDMALEVNEKSLSIKMAERDTVGAINSLYNIGLAYSHLNRFSEALDALMAARDLSEKYADTKWGMANIDIGIGIAYFNLGNNAEAAQFLADGIKSSGAINYETIVATAYLGAIDVKNGKITEGIRRIEEAYGHSAASGRKDLHRSILKERAVAYEKASNYYLANESWKAYSAVSDSINHEARQWAIEELQARFELKEKEATISLQNLRLEKEASQRRWYLAFGILVVSALLIISLFLYKILKQRKQLKSEIAEKEQALDLNKSLLKEMHHRVKNNLQVVSSLLNMHVRKVRDHDSKKILEEGSERLLAMSLIHKNLYPNADLNNVSVDDYLFTLSRQLFDNYQLQNANVALETELEKISVDIDKLVPIGLIVNELVSNAMKHAFSEDADARISIRLRAADDNHIELQVADNGKGIDHESTKKETDSIGMKLISIFSEKLESKLRIINESGTKVTLLIPQ